MGHTLFIASLNLPYTVSFDSKSGVNERDESRRQTTPVPNLIESLASRSASGQNTPVNGKSLDSKLEALLLSSEDASTSNERRHRTILQPKSRATSPHMEEVSLTLPTKAATIAVPRSKRRDSRVEKNMALIQSPWSIEDQTAGVNGGLINAISSAKSHGILDNLNLTPKYVGSLGMPTDSLTSSLRSQISEKLLNKSKSCLPVFVTDQDYEGHYTQFCKQILWPMFHHIVPDNPQSSLYVEISWKHYIAVNRAFAELIAENYKPGDLIWIHDYHLLLLPSMLRQMLPNARIGFFLHVAFPSSEVFRCLTVRRELLEGIVGASMIAFQTTAYAHHFLQTCSRILFVEILPEGIVHNNNFVCVLSVPIGIDPTVLKTKMLSPEVARCKGLLRERYEDMKIFVARDKLDHVKVTAIMLAKLISAGSSTKATRI